MPQHLLLLYGLHIHVFLSILGLFGVFLLYRWIVNNLPGYKQRNIALWALGIGGIGILLTVPFCILAVLGMHM